jgi:hypothetical protein
MEHASKVNEDAPLCTLLKRNATESGDAPLSVLFSAEFQVFH